MIVAGSRAGAVAHQDEACLYPGSPLRARLGTYVAPFPAPATSARSTQIYCTTRSCTLHLKGHETYPAGTTFDRGRSRWSSNKPRALYSYRLLHRFQPKPRRRKHQDRSAFAPKYSLLLRSCRSMGADNTSPLPPLLSKSLCAVRPLRSVGVTPLHHYCEPRRHRLVFQLTSRCRRL